MQKLFKEEGYKDAKLLFICNCRNEKEQKRELEKQVRNLFTAENILFWRITMTCALIVAKKAI